MSCQEIIITVIVTLWKKLMGRLATLLIINHTFFA